MAEYRLPPRQKMINLVYIILIAMLAINISADTLDTYSLLDKGLRRRADKLESYRAILRDSLLTTVDGASGFIASSDSMADALLADIDGIKEAIAKSADKKHYVSADELQALEELNAVPDVMLSAINPRGSRLKNSIVLYMDTVMAKVTDTSARELIAAYLDLDHDKKLTSWEKETFTSMPAIGGMVYMNTLRENVLLAEIQMYQDILENHYRKTAAMAAADDNSRYVLINNDQKVVSVDGTIEVPVVDVAPYLESVLYAEYDNLIDVLAIGITPEEIDFRISGGRHFLRNGKLYISPDPGAEKVTLSMNCVRKGERKYLGSKEFRVKSLPTPVPYIRFRDGSRYTGTVPVEAEKMAEAYSVGAGITEPVEIEYRVAGFELVLIKNNSGEVLSAVSEGPYFTSEQKKILASAQNADKMYFTGISVRNPKGDVKYQIPPISVPLYE